MAARKKTDEAVEAEKAVPAAEAEAEDKGAEPAGEITPAPEEATETDRLSAEAKAPAPASAPEAAPEDPATGERVPAAALAAGVPAPPNLVVVVLGPKKGRWRAKRHFGPEPMRIPADELTAEEKEQLLSDPQLIVSVIEAGSPL